MSEEKGCSRNLKLVLLLLSWRHKLVFNGKCSRFAAARQPQFLQDMADMVARGLFADVQRVSNLFVGISTCYQRQHFAFSLGEFTTWYLRQAFHNLFCGIRVDQ